MENIMEWVKSGLLFGILSAVILLLCPNKSYEKHMNLVVGLLFILVMIHPIMAFLDLDGQTYIAYIQNYIAASENGGYLSENEINLYGDSLRLQLKNTLLDAGYPVSDIRVTVNDAGSVTCIGIHFEGEVPSVAYIDEYLKNVFGNEVEIIYE